MYCLTRKTLNCNCLIQKICMFLQKETLHYKDSLVLGPQGPKWFIFDDHFYSKNGRNLRLQVFLLIHVRKYMTSLFYLKWTKFTRSCKLWVHREQNQIGTNSQFTISCEFGLYQVKWWYHMFSSIKMEE